MKEIHKTHHYSSFWYDQDCGTFIRFLRNELAYLFIMIETKTFSPNVFNSFAIQAYRLVFGRILPQSLFRDKIPAEADRKAVKGKFDLEIVSHCWGYANMLTYQLSSFVNYPPTKLNLTVTVFYAEEDTKTKATLDFFSQITMPNITWKFLRIANT